MNSKKKHSPKELKIIEKALAKHAKIKGPTLIEQFCNLKIKLDESSPKRWKSLIQPSDEIIQDLIIKRRANKEIKQANDALDLITSSVSRKKSPNKRISNTLDLDKEEYEIEVDPNIESRNIYDHLTIKYGAKEFDSMIRKKSLFQFKDSKKLFYNLYSVVNGVKAVLNKNKRILKLSSLANISETDPKVYSGTLLIFNPISDTSSSLLKINLKYANESGAIEDFSFSISSDGKDFGMVINTELNDTNIASKIK